MNVYQKHANYRLREAVKYVSRQWGPGFHRLGMGQQESLVRAEMLADIHRIARPDMDPATYHGHVEAMAEAAMRWEGGEPMTKEQAAQALKLLRSVLSDIEMMRNREDYFGGFFEWTTDSSDAAVIEWPNLSIVGRDIAAFLQQVKKED